MRPTEMTLTRRIADLESRLDHLDRSRRRWRAGAATAASLAMLGAVLGVGLGTHAPQHGLDDDVVHARRMMILNDDGIPVVTLGAREQAGWIRLTDRYGDARAEIIASRDGASLLRLTTGDRHPGVVARADASGGDVEIFDGSGAGAEHRLSSLAGVRSASPQETDPAGLPETPLEDATLFTPENPPDARPSAREDEHADPHHQCPDEPADGEAFDAIIGDEFGIDQRAVPIIVARWVREHHVDEPPEDRARRIDEFTDRLLGMDMTLTIDPAGSWTVIDRTRPAQARSIRGSWSQRGETLRLEISDPAERWDRDRFILRHREDGGVLLYPQDESARPPLPFRRR